MIIKDTIRILLIEDEQYDVKRVRNTLAPFKDQLQIKEVVADGQAALDALHKNDTSFDVVIMDYQIVGGVSGERLIRMIKAIDPSIQIIVITKMTVNITDFDFANRLLDAGAMWYCTKYPGDIEDYIYQPTDFILSIINAYEKKRLEREKNRSEKKLDRNIKEILNAKAIIGDSAPIQQLREQIEKLSGHEANVLITGDSGTGKELVATHLHYTSPRRYEKFVAINCGSLPHELIESELFGFEKGAFTGAGQKKDGLFEVANHGTAFLDEVAELPFSAQVKLLRFLQEGEIDKIGRTDKIKVDARIIAATNKDLKQLVQEKRFREDLYYRLNVVVVHVPSLCERREDIPLLLDHFMKSFAYKFSLTVPRISDEAMHVLKEAPWPGNIRQLQNIVQRLLYLQESVINAREVQLALGTSRQVTAANAMDVSWNQNEIKPWREMEINFKRKYFNFVRNHSASDAEAARRLGLAPPNYYRMCKELGLK